MKDELKLVIEALINEDIEEAAMLFHSYLSETIKLNMNIADCVTVSEDTE